MHCIKLLQQWLISLEQSLRPTLPIHSYSLDMNTIYIGLLCCRVEKCAEVQKLSENQGKFMEILQQSDILQPRLTCRMLLRPWWNWCRPNSRCYFGRSITSLKISCFWFPDMFPVYPASLYNILTFCWLIKNQP